MPRRRSPAPASRLEPHAPSGPRQRPSRSHLGQKVVQRLLVGYPEVREHVMVDRYAHSSSGGVVLFAQTRKPAGAPYTVGQQPQRQEHLGVRRWSAGPVLHRLDRLKRPTSVSRKLQIERMLLGQHRFQVHRRPFKLIPHRAQPGSPGTVGAGAGLFSLAGSSNNSCLHDMDAQYCLAFQ